jgi:hypothetical protein
MTAELGYRYLAVSTLRPGEGAARLDLATSGGATAAGESAHPFFFSGFVEHPTVVAQSLLVIARVARTRFYAPPGALAAVLRAADPVVTSTPEGLRFESFSVCCGVYARLDVEADALDAAHTAAGVTNVDVNPPLREALASLRAAEPLRLNIGDDGLRVATLDAEVVEERVPLPDRWLKGFAETQLLSARMAEQHTLDAAAARAFVQGLPKTSAAKTVMWAARAAGGLRLASRPSAGAVCAAGPERLRVIEPLLRFATGMRSYAARANATSLPMASAWVLGLPGARLTIALSPEKTRGFSGEGAVLHALSTDEVEADADLLSALLAFEPRIDVQQLAADAAISPERALGALSLLASSGQVGYDLAAGAYFHRPLPVRADVLDTLHPRLADARRLVAAEAVTVRGDGVRQVRSGGVDYEVRLATDAADDRCTCPWQAKHRGARGPCKHVLAARIHRDGLR